MWHDFYSKDCKTGRFIHSEDYEISRRGYSVALKYYGTISIANGVKAADVFYGIHDGGVIAGEGVFFALMGKKYSSSPILEKALQKLWSGKTNKLKAIYHIAGTERTRV